MNLNHFSVKQSKIRRKNVLEMHTEKNVGLISCTTTEASVTLTFNSSYFIVSIKMKLPAVLFRMCSCSSSTGPLKFRVNHVST